MYNNEYMGMFAYADDISLLCHTLSGIKKKTCYRVNNSMPLITKLSLMILKVSYYISVV